MAPAFAFAFAQMSTTTTFAESRKREFACGLSRFFSRVLDDFYPEVKDKGYDVLVMARQPINEEVIVDVLPSEGTPIGDVLYVCVPVVEMFPAGSKYYNPSLLTEITHNDRQMSVDVVELELIDGKWCQEFIQEDNSDLRVEVGSLKEIHPMIALAVNILGVHGGDCMNTFTKLFIFPPIC